MSVFSNLFELSLGDQRKHIYRYERKSDIIFKNNEVFTGLDKDSIISFSQKETGKEIENPDLKYFTWLIKKEIYRGLEKLDQIIDNNKFGNSFSITTNPLFRCKEYSILRKYRWRVISINNSFYLVVDSGAKIFNRLSIRDLINSYGLSKVYISHTFKKCFAYVEVEGKRSWLPAVIKDVFNEKSIVEIVDVFDGTISISNDRILPEIPRKNYSDFHVQSPEISKVHDNFKKAINIYPSEEYLSNVDAVNNTFYPILKTGESIYSISDKGKVINTSNIDLIVDTVLPKYKIERQGQQEINSSLMQGLSKFDLTNSAKNKNVVVFFPTNAKKIVKDLLVNLNSGIKSGEYFFSLPSKFGIKLNVIKHYEVTSIDDYFSAINEYIESSSPEIKEALVLIYLPESSESYYKIKAILANHGRVSQVISKANFDIYSAWNISANIYAKLGEVPWSIDNSSSKNSDLVLGLSYSSMKYKGRLKRNIGHVNVFDRNGIWKFMKSGAAYLDFEKRHIEIPDLIGNSIIDYLSTNDTLKSIDIHFTKKFSFRERKGIYSKIQSINSNIEEINFISLNTSHIFKMYDSKANNYKVTKGTIIYLDDNQFLIASSSNKFVHKLIEVNVWRHDNLSLTHNELRDIAERILIMTRLNWKSAIKETTEPVTTKFSSEVAKLTNHFSLTEWKEVNNQLANLPWFI